MTEKQISHETNERGKKLVDVSELLRVYGELKNHVIPDDIRHNKTMTQVDTPTITTIYEGRISALEREVEELREERDRKIKERESDREESKKREEWLQGKIDQITPLLEDKRTQQPESKVISPKVLWVFLPVCVIITAMPLVAWFLLDFLKQ